MIFIIIYLLEVQRNLVGVKSLSVISIKHNNVIKGLKDLFLDICP